MAARGRASPAAGAGAGRNGGNKRRIPLGLLPYSSSESEDDEVAPSAIGARLRHCVEGNAKENRGAAAGAAAAPPKPRGTPKKRRKTAVVTAGGCGTSPTKAASSPACVSARARQSPARPGFIDITMPGLSLAHSGRGSGAQAKHTPKAAAAVRPSAGPPVGAVRTSGGRQPSASAASANREEVSRALSAEEQGTMSGAPSSSPASAAAAAARSARNGPQTPAGAPPGSRTVRACRSCISLPRTLNQATPNSTMMLTFFRPGVPCLADGNDRLPRARPRS